MKKLILCHFIVVANAIFWAQTSGAKGFDDDVLRFLQTGELGNLDSDKSETEDEPEVSGLSEELLMFIRASQFPPEKEYMALWNEFYQILKEFREKKVAFESKAQIWIDQNTEDFIQVVPEFDEVNELNNQAFDEYRAREEESPFMQVVTLYSYLLTSDLEKKNFLKEMIIEFAGSELKDATFRTEYLENLSASEDPGDFSEAAEALILGYLKENFTANLSDLKQAAMSFKMNFFRTRGEFLQKETQSYRSWIKRIDKISPLVKG